MRRPITAALTGCGLMLPLTGFGHQAPAPPSEPPADRKAPDSPAQPEVDALLAAWAERAATRSTLQVAFERVDKFRKRGDKVYAGQAFYQGPELCLEFRAAQTGPDGKPRRRQVDGRTTLETDTGPADRIIWTSRSVSRFDGDLREVMILPLEQMRRARHVFDLPFLFNQTATEVKRRFALTLLPQKDPALAERAYLIRLVPREEIDRQLYREAYLYLDRRTFLPDRLILVAASDPERQDFTFTTIRVNEPIPESVFAADRIPAGWKVWTMGDPIRELLERLGVRRAGASGQPAPTEPVPSEKQDGAR